MCHLWAMAGKAPDPGGDTYFWDPIPPYCEWLWRVLQKIELYKKKLQVIQLHWLGEKSPTPHHKVYLTVYKLSWLGMPAWVVRVDRKLHTPAPSGKHCLHFGMLGKIDLKLGITKWTLQFFFLQSFSFIYGITACVCWLFLVLMTATFLPL